MAQPNLTGQAPGGGSSTNRDLVSFIRVGQSLSPIAGSATRTGLGVDLKGYEGAVFVVTVNGLDTPTTGNKQTIQFQHYDTDTPASYENCVGPVAVGGVPPDLQEDPVIQKAINEGNAALAALKLVGSTLVIDDIAKDDRVYQIGYCGTRRWVRAISTLTGTLASLVFGIQVVKGYPRVYPAL